MVQYVVAGGEVPEGFASVEVTVRPVFVEDPGDLGPCDDGVYRGPYKPTLTPIRTPAGDCQRSGGLTVDIAADEGNRTAPNVTAPRWAGGHALVVTDVTATLEDGTEVASVKNVGGAELLASERPPAGRHGVELTVETVTDDRDYDYWLVWERFEPGARDR